MSQESDDSNWMSKVQKQLLGKKFLRIYHIVGRVICVATLAVQLGILDYYLIEYRSLYWLLWLIADAVVLSLFIFTVIVSYRYLRHRPTEGPKHQRPRRHFGELPWIYVSWFVYSIVLSAKICCIYALPDSIALRLSEEYFFGPNMLRTAVSLASIVVYVLVLTSYDARSHSKQDLFVQTIVGSIYLDVLDTTEFLGTIRDESLVITHYHLDIAILAISCFNFVLPTEGLFVLSWKHFGKVPVSAKFRFFHKVLYYVVVNLPFFIVRLVIWHLHDKHVSVFLVKNVLGIFLAIQHLHEWVMDMSGVIKSNVHAGDAAAATGEHGSTEMRMLTAAARADKDRSAAIDEIEMAAIHI